MGVSLELGGAVLSPDNLACIVKLESAPDQGVLAEVCMQASGVGMR